MYLQRGIFVTGTDTNVGKTRVTLGIMEALQKLGLRVAGMKPVASGCRWTPEGLRNEDAEQILAQSSLALTYPDINPFAFAPPIAPHIAAAEAGVTIQLEFIEKPYRALVLQTDYCIVEGAGGWLVPLTATDTMADLVRRLEIPVILVVRISLGCLNHALLSVESIQYHGAVLLGWVANVLNPGQQCISENVAALASRIPAPLLGLIPWLPLPAPAEFSMRLQGLGKALGLDRRAPQAIDRFTF